MDLPENWQLQGGRPLPHLATADDIQAFRQQLPTLGNGLARRRSRIRGAGNGLFTTRDFAAGEIITYYDGPIVRYVPLDEMPSKYVTHAVVLMRLRYSILGNHESARLGEAGHGAAALANHDPEHMNAILTFLDSDVNEALLQRGATELFPYDRIKLLVATRDIAANTEVLTSYDDLGWENVMQPAKHSAKKEVELIAALQILPPFEEWKERERQLAEEQKQLQSKKRRITLEPLAPAKRRELLEPAPEAEEIWRNLLEDPRVHQMRELPILDLSQYLRTHPAIAAFAEEAYLMAFWRDMQAPMRGGLYGFAARILSEYRGPDKLSARECYSLANVTLAWAASQAAGFFGDSVNWYTFVVEVARRFHRTVHVRHVPPRYDIHYGLNVPTAGRIPRPRRDITSTALLPTNWVAIPFNRMRGDLMGGLMFPAEEPRTLVRIAMPSPNEQYWHARSDLEIGAVEIGDHYSVADDAVRRVRYAANLEGHSDEDVFELSVECDATELGMRISALNVERFFRATRVVMWRHEIASSYIELPDALYIFMLHLLVPEREDWAEQAAAAGIDVLRSALRTLGDADEPGHEERLPFYRLRPLETQS